MYILSLNRGDIIGIVLVALLIIIFVINRLAKKKEEDHHTVYESIKNTAPVTAEEEPLESTEKSDDEPQTPLERLADSFENTSVWELMSLLKKPFKEVCLAATAAQAEEAYDNAESYSEMEYVALIKWIELEEDFDRMDDLEDAADDTPYLEKLVDEKRSALALKKISGLSTEEELRAILDEVPDNSPAEIAILQKLYDLYQKA